MRHRHKGDIPNETTLGAIAKSPLLFYNFFEHGRSALPTIAADKRQSEWNLKKSLWKGATFVHYLKDDACPFHPTSVEQKALFENNSRKLVLLYSQEQTYGTQGHSYGNEYLALAKLPKGTFEVHAARTQTEVGDSKNQWPC